MLNNQQLLNLMTVGLLFLSTAAPTIAQSIANRSTTTNGTLSRVLFRPPQDDKKPEERTAGGGSRQDTYCLQDATSGNLANSQASQDSLMLLVPPNNFGLTTAERPKLWIDLPATSARQLVLSIREEGTTHHSKTFIPITGDSATIALQPSADSPRLEVGKTYLWSVVLVCGEKPSPNDPALETWVSRFDTPQPINQGSALEQAAWYGEQGIWYDALTSLIQARRSQPHNQDLIRIWTDFLESGGLKEIASEPLQF